MMTDVAVRICKECKIEKPLSEYWKDGRSSTKGRYIKRNPRCKVCANAIQNAEYTIHREERLAYARQRLSSYRGVALDRPVTRQAIYQQRARMKVLNRYGGKCDCCGETREEFLCIDHIAGVGAGRRHRKNMKRASIYLWLLFHGCPQEGFRILCYNCNCAIGFRGYCPHAKERALLAAA